jgi:uncharacterized protein YtpQ (UPF0354 family)
MKNLLIAAALLVFAFLTNNALAAEKVITPTEFTRQYLSKIKALRPDIIVSTKADFELVFKDKDGNEYNFFLENAYLHYKNDPESLNRVLESYALSGLDTLAGFDKAGESLANIVPVIKHAGYIAEITQSLKQSDQDLTKLSLYHESLNPKLIVLYAMDTERNIRYMTETEISDLKLAPGQLRQLAIDNLAGILPLFQIHGDQGRYMLMVGGNYEASLLLADAIWTKENFTVDGDFVVAIPSRDVLLVTGSRSAENLVRIAGVAKKIHAEAPYNISTQMFIRRDEQWHIFSSPDQDQ